MFDVEDFEEPEAFESVDEPVVEDAESFELFGRKWHVSGFGIGIDETDDLEYSDIIKALHPTITWIFEFEDDYQGDFFCCGCDKQGKWYFIQGSFGSCSGCDWLESIETKETAIELLTHYKREIIEKNSKQEIIQYMLETTKNTYSRDTLEKLIKKISAMPQKEDKVDFNGRLEGFKESI